MARHLHLVVDREAHDPALSALVAELAQALPDTALCIELVPARDTVAAGRLVAARALERGSAGMVVAHDVAPGPDDPGAWPDGCASCFCAARSETGVLVVGPNAGWTWAAAAEHGLATQLIRIDIPSAGPPPHTSLSFAEAVVHAMRGHSHAIAGTIAGGGAAPMPVRS
jgi:hypothetical protein